MKMVKITIFWKNRFLQVFYIVTMGRDLYESCSAKEALPKLKKNFRKRLSLRREIVCFVWPACGHTKQTVTFILTSFRYNSTYQAVAGELGIRPSIVLFLASRNLGTYADFSEKWCFGVFTHIWYFSMFLIAWKKSSYTVFVHKALLCKNMPKNRTSKSFLT